MRINIGVLLIFFAVIIYILTKIYSWNDLLAYLLAGMGASQLDNYWEIEK